MYFNTIRIIFVVRIVLFMENIKDISPTLLDYAILGLIKDQPLTGYGIRKLFEETALGNFSSSPGTIYPALKRLQKFKLVEKYKNANSYKNPFNITQIGLLVLKNWVLQKIEKIDVEKNTDELMLRFAFMESLTEKNEKINFLTSYKVLLKMYIKELHSFYAIESHAMPLHGRLAFQYGIDSNKVKLKWCKKAISQLI